MNKSDSWDSVFPFWTVYRSGGFSDTDFVRVCSSAPSLTINESYFDPKYNNKTRDETIFNEVSMLLPGEKINPKFRYLFEPMNEYIGDLRGFALELKQKLKDFYLDVWDSNRPHLFLHSSGYDSRILSGILVELRDEMGKDWVGDIHFRCHQPEGPGFMKIMKREGWKPNQYSNWEGPDYDHYDLGRKDKILNGFISYVSGMNFWRDIVPPEEEKDYICITGLGGGELLSYPACGLGSPNKLKWCGNKVFDKYLNYFPDRGVFTSNWYNKFHDLIIPYLSYSYLSTALKIPERFQRLHKRPLDVVRHELLCSFDMDLLNVPWFKHDYNFKISEERASHMMESWRNSLFYRRYSYRDSIRAVDPLNFRNNSFSARMYGFMTCYDEIMRRRGEMA